MMLQGKAAVVTGAGRGIGGEIALLLAREGAKLIVNDFANHGEDGRRTRVADEVVREIKNQGGEAVTNQEAVATREGAKRIIQTAIDISAGLTSW